MFFGEVHNSILFLSILIKRAGYIKDLKKNYLAALGLSCGVQDLHAFSRGMWDLVP